MRKLALTLVLLLFVFAQEGCASDVVPDPVPDAGAGPAQSYHPLTAAHNQGEIEKEIVHKLQQAHYNKIKLDNAFSEKLFNAYLNGLDSTHSVFLASDVKRLRQKYGDKLDNELEAGATRGAYAIFNTYQKRSIQIDRWALHQIKQGIDTLNIHSKQSINTDRKHAPWPADASARRALWTKQLESQVIAMRLDHLQPKKIEKRLSQRYGNQLKQQRQAEPGDVFSAYMTAYTHSYDPHTDYFSPRRVQDFSINMNLQLQGVGAELREQNGYAELVRLIPGGPAAQNGQIKPTDRIIAVGQGKHGPFTDVVGMRLDKTVQLIRGKAGSTVRLQIAPPGGGQTKTVTLTRAKIKLKDQTASSRIIHVKRHGHMRKIGLIILPSFYNGTADDVKKQLAKLKSQHIDGIVLDLLNNGGGALGEAMRLIGLFMPSAPGVQIKDAQGNVQVLGDRSSGTYYTGPLAVQVNRLSASASEIVAGALQDYGRAVIVGSQTFGKGTVQTLLPLSKGQLKLTEAKFYRVTGGSTQDRGVTPGIKFPSAINPKKIGESALPNALPWNRVPPTRYPYSDQIAKVLSKLRAEHVQRIAHEPDFQYLVKRYKLARKESGQTQISLNLGKRRAEQKARKQKILALANSHRKAIGKPPFKNYKAFEDNTHQGVSAAPGENSDAIPRNSSAAKTDAYQKETANIVLDLARAVAAKETSAQAA